MADLRALVVATPRALDAHRSGAALRLADVLSVLEDAGYAPTTTSPADLVRGRLSTADVGVAVSFATAGALPALRKVVGRLWLDAVDSWRLLDVGGLRAGHPTYGLRLVRDAVRLARAPEVDLATWISGRDLRADGRTVKAKRHAVLPGRLVEQPPAPAEAGGRRLVTAGDWDYPPNRDGLAWLQRRVLPLLPRPVHVYGPGRVRGGSGLVVHGYAADADELRRTGDVHLAPVLWGSGVKRKVLDPLLAGLTVVATPAAAAGLRPHPRLVVMSTPEAFAAAAAALLDQPPLGPHGPPQSDGDDRDDIIGWLRGD